MDGYKASSQSSSYLYGSETTHHGSVLQCVEKTKKLECSVFNHVSLGQWEAARACLSSLAADPTSWDNARELLKILVLEATTYWSESAAVPSPHHLSWLALETYKTLFPNDKEVDQLPSYVQDLVEFRLLLFAANGLPSFSTRVATDLCNYHALHVLKIPGSSADTVPQLQPLILQFLHDVITSLNPTLGHALVTSLMVTGGSSYLANNEALQMIYVDCINESLEALSQSKVSDTADNDSSYDSQYESDHPSTETHKGIFKECEKKVAFVYTLLSLADPSNEMTRVTNRLDRLFHTLLKTTFKIGPGLSLRFETGRVYACLLGRSSPLLINWLHEVEEYLRMNRGFDHEEEEVAATTTDDSTPHHHRHKETPSIQETEWKERFYQALYDHKHLLESIIDSGLQLVFTGKLPELSQQMMRPEYVPLRPVLLLLGWDRYSAAGSGRELLDSLWPMEVSMKQSLLFDGCCKLAFQVELVQWCLDKARPHVQIPTLLTINRAGDMFKGLETHSTLYVLHHSTPLATLDPMEVIHILKMRPKVPSLSGGSGTLTPPPQFSREATPMKLLSESDTSPTPSPMFGSGIGQKSLPTVSHSVLKPEQERDIAIFRSFCVMRLVMDAIWNSVQLANNTHPSLVAAAAASDSKLGSGSQASKASGLREQKLLPKAARKLDLGEENGSPPQQEDSSKSSSEKPTSANKESSGEPLHSRLYRNLVLDKLHEAKVYLSLIHPLNYRLEILEDMFSLLFLTSDEIKQPKMSEGMDGSSLTPPGGVASSSSLHKTDSFSSPGNIDGIATAISSIALIKSQHTFLVDEDVASDLLDMLTDCMFELRAAKYALNQQNEAAVGGGSSTSGDLSPTTAVKSSVPHTSLHPRSSKLEQFINEARWRLKLVSSKYGITAGLSPAMVIKYKGQPVTFDLFSSSDESVFELSDSEDEKEKKEVRKRSRKTPSSSEMREKEAMTSRTTPTPLQVDSLLDGKSPHKGPTSSIGRPSSVITNLSSQLSSPAPRPRSITPKSRRSVSPVPLKLKRHGSASGPISKLKVSSSSKGSLRGSRHTSPSSSAQSTGKTLPITATKLEDDSGDYAADVEEKSPDTSSSRKRKRLKSRASQTNIRKRWQRKSERSESGFSKNSVVCKMLASPGSLLRMCLKHSNYTKAKEVVKMFQMEGKFGEDFIKFSEDFERVSSELSRRPQPGVKGSHSSPGKPFAKDASSLTQSLSTALKGKPAEGTRRHFSTETLTTPSSASTSLQEAILNATSNSEPLDCLHRLLTPTSISKMLFSGDEQLEKVAQESAMLRGLSDHVQALIMLDLVCSSRVDGQLAKRIIETAVSRSQSSSLHSKAPSTRRVKGSHSGSGAPELIVGGPFLLLQTFYEVAGYFAFPGVQQQSVVQQPYSSPHTLLSGSLHQLDVTTMRNSKAFVDSLRTSREKLEYVICQKQSELSATTSEILLELSQSSGRTEEAPSSTAQQPSSFTIFDDVVRALSGTPDFISLPLSSPSPSSSSSSKEHSLMRRPPSAVRLSLLDDTSGHGVRYTYVRQFSRYLVKLVELLVKCLAIAKSDANKEMLIVSVLRDGPSQLLGWLVFEQGVKPHRLETMMGDFPQLRIVDVLVKCCCPQLPSNAALSKKALPSTPPVISLNNHDVTATPTDPCELSYELLNKLTNILKSCPTSIPSQGGVVTPDDLVHMYNSPEVQKILKQTAQFASVDLSLLDTPLKRLVFYANVANLLYAHALMVYFVSLSYNRGSGRGPHGIAESDILMVPSIQSSRTLQFTYFTKVGYRIGQLGLVSCFDLHHTILRQGLTTPTLVKGMEIETRLKPAESDPWFTYAPPTSDPRLLYVVHNGRLTSPVPCPLTVADFETTIKSAEQSYINSTIVINTGKRALHLPEWLYENRERLGRLIWEEGSAPSDSAQHCDVSFLSYIQTHIDKDKADWLKPYADVTDPGKSKKITFVPEPDSLKLGFNFGSKATTPNKSPRGSPKMRRKGLSREMSRKELTLLPTFHEEPTCGTRHSFTPETVAFIKQRTPLISALVHLVCLAPSTGAPGKTGIEDEPGIDDKSEVEQSTKKSFMQSLRSKSIKPGSSPTHKRSTSVDEQQIQLRLKQDPWKRQYDEVLSHFESFSPMRRYLTARLTCFEAVIGWDMPHPHKETTKPSMETGTKSPTEIVDGKEFPVSLRRLAALSTTSNELGEACSFVMKKLVEDGKIGEAVQFLSSEPATGNVPRTRFLKDMAISCLFVKGYRELPSLGQGGEDDKPKMMVVQNPVALLSQLSDTELAARLTLSSLQNWPVDVCVDLLSYCYHHISPSSTLASIISRKLQRMRVYSQIMATCKDPESVRPWRNWSELENDTESKPDFVMEALLGTKKFDLIRCWAEVHDLESRFSQQIEVEYLFDLLEGHNSDPIAAHQVLDGIADEKTTFKVCEALLNRTDLQTSLFVLHYMLTRLSHSVAINRSHYSNRLLGAKALLCLPPEEQKTYESFLHSPLLLVEELFIDSKIEWAGKVIGQLRANEHLSNISTVDTPILERRLVMPGEVQGEEERDNDPFTTLLMFYCDKALEFPQSTVVLKTPAESIAPSMAPTSPPSPGGGSVAPAPSLGASQRFASSAAGVSIPGGNPPMSPPHRSGASLDFLGQYPIMTPKQTFVPRRRASSNLMSPLLPVPESESEGDGEFKPPSQPPTKHQWESDNSTRVCRVCKQVSFNMFVRRHHCRRCGRVVCAECSNKTAIVKGYNQPVRVCNDCYPHCVTSEPTLPTDDALPNVSALDGQNELDLAFPPQSPTHFHHWVLIPSDPHYNQTIRKAFYYERTPNMTLFLSLLDLIENKKLAAAFILDCCRTVSLQLMPDSTYSDEIDHNFVIELIENLLMNAKLRFANSSDSAGVELCDTYLSRVELLHLLVTSQCSTIPSLQELTNPDLARRVRDRLIQDDRFSLAMEVSTKCQLDASAVWSAWGMMALKSGDFKTARAKFIRCFQVSSQSKLASSGGQNLQLLHRIVEQIEQYPLCVTGRQTQHSEDWTAVLTGSMALTNEIPDECKYRFNECVYYLRAYGNHSTLISFYVRQSRWLKAAKYILENRCSVDLFVDFFWVPALKMGEIMEVEGHLKSLDPSLEVWHAYLTAACRYFTQKGLYSVLYHTQLLMNDQIRAGMTCTKFFVGFSGRSTTISELHSRLHYLDSARRHFQTALDTKSRTLDRPWSSRSGRTQSEPQRKGPSGAKSMSAAELEKHIATIDLQIKVTRFLFQNADPSSLLSTTASLSHAGGGGAEASLSSSGGWGKQGGSAPPTLFGSGHARAEVAVQVLTLSQDIVEGNSIAREIIQMYKLPVTNVYCSVSRVLAAKQQYGDIRLLLQCIQKTAQSRSYSLDSLCDEIIMAAIKVLSNQAKEAKQVDKLVLLLNNERSKIKGYIQCGKLKNAYLIAIKSKLIDEVKNISEIAGRAGQLAVRDICEKWLAQQQPH